MHRVEFIGAGPGDPTLLTLAGREALNRCRAVLAPESLARSFQAFLEGKEVESPFQMDHEAVAEWIETRLERSSVAVLMPGDFGCFCPFQSFVARFGDRGHVIPGIGAYAAAAAILRRTFDVAGASSATVLTSPRALRASGLAPLRDFVRPGQTLILYMNDLPLPELTAELRVGFGGNVPIAILEHISLPEERITTGLLDDIVERVGGRDPFRIAANDPEPALALVVAGTALGVDEDPSAWDRRYERIWKVRGVR